jgi:hypothetical protein
MQKQPRPQFAGFDRNQSEHGDFLGFKMNPQPDPVLDRTEWDQLESQCRRP